MVEYFLPRHVHFCCRGDALVFLDLKRDNYMLVNGNSAAALLSLSPSEQVHESNLSEALRELQDGGLLTTDQSAGKEVAPTRIELAMELLVDPEAMPETHIAVGDIWRFIFACTIAAMRLRKSALHDTVEAIERRKTRLSSKPLDTNRARELTAIFRRLRSFFPREYVCLYDSLALLEYLARYRIFPTWVFAVRLEPWAAHCWVQQGQFIFNEGVEEAAAYTPVMIV